MKIFIIICLLVLISYNGFSQTIEQQMAKQVFLSQQKPFQGKMEQGFYYDETNIEPRSPRKAVLLSLLLPGLGQAYAGKTRRMYPYLGVEAVTWSVYGLYRYYGNLREDDYKLYAAVHAGIEPEGKSKRYFDALEDYISSEDFNEDALRDVRFEMFNRAPQLYTNEDRWEWDSESSQEEYKDMKHDSWLAFKKATYTLGFAVLNRIVSAIDAARQAKLYNRTGKNSAWNVRVKPITKLDNYGALVVFKYSR